MVQAEQRAMLAEAAAMEGRWADAERLWGEVAAIDPGHARARHRLGIHAFQRGAFAEAVEHLGVAVSLQPGDPMPALMLANALRELGRSDEELAALTMALDADPYFYPALLARGAAYERLGRATEAAMTYRNVLKICPPEPHWPDGLRDGLVHARRIADAYGDALAAALAESVGGWNSLDGKWREAVSIMAGRTRPYHSDCNQLHVPRLPAIPFFEREMFPWVAAVEAETAAIREELQAALSARGDAFAPYIAYNPGEPVNQWAELNHSNRWSTLSLWRGGVPDAENLAACPRTAAALQAVDMADIGGLCPNAMFSALAPHTVIPPHHGETNARLVVHLPLIVPEGCSYRVGFEQRGWEEGKLLIFDDTLEHTARNDGDALRVVLIFDVWNPLLSKAEREMVTALTAAARDFAFR